MDDIETKKVLDEILNGAPFLNSLKIPEEGKQMSDIEISVSSIRISAKKLAQYSSKIESTIKYVCANLSKMDREVFHFEAEINVNLNIVIEMQFTFDGSREKISFRNPNKKEILNKAREMANKIHDHSQVIVIFKEIRKIFNKRGLTLVLEYDKPKCAEIRFVDRYEKGSLKYTIADDHLHLHRIDTYWKKDDLGVSVPLADPGLLDPVRLLSNLRSMLCGIADYNIKWMTAVKDKVESLSFFSTKWKHSADSVFKDQE